MQVAHGVAGWGYGLFLLIVYGLLELTSQCEVVISTVRGREQVSVVDRFGLGAKEAAG